MHDQVQAALEVVEHRQLFGMQQQDVRRAQLVAATRRRQARFDVADALKAKPADQAPGEAGQTGQLRHRVGAAQGLDLGERIGDLAGFHHGAGFADGQGMAVEGIHPARRQADDGIAPEAFAALDRFKQIGMRAVGELQIDRERRVQVGQHFTDDGDAGVAFSGLLLELLERDQDDFPSGKRRWRDGRRQQATIATNGERKKGYAGSSEWTPGDCTSARRGGEPRPGLRAAAPRPTWRPTPAWSDCPGVSTAAAGAHWPACRSGCPAS